MTPAAATAPPARALLAGAFTPRFFNRRRVAVYSCVRRRFSFRRSTASRRRWRPTSAGVGARPAAALARRVTPAGATGAVSARA